MIYCNLRRAHKHISSKIPAGTKVTNMWGKIRISQTFQFRLVYGEKVPDFAQEVAASGCRYGATAAVTRQ